MYRTYGMPRVQGCTGAAMYKEVLYATGAWMRRSGDVQGSTVVENCSVIALALLYRLHPCRRPAFSTLPSSMAVVQRLQGRHTGRICVARGRTNQETESRSPERLQRSGYLHG